MVTAVSNCILPAWPPRTDEARLTRPASICIYRDNKVKQHIRPDSFLRLSAMQLDEQSLSPVTQYVNEGDP